MFFRYNFYSLSWGLLILALSLYPGKELPGISFWDLLSFEKACHMFFYAVFVFLLINGFSKQYSWRFPRYHAKLTGTVFAIVYGGVIEVLQNRVAEDRVADIMDFIANFIGCLAGLLVFRIIYLKIR